MVILMVFFGGQSWFWSNGVFIVEILIIICGLYIVVVMDSNSCIYIFGFINIDFDELFFFLVCVIFYDENGDIEGYVYDSLMVCEGEDVYLEVFFEFFFDIEWSNGNNNDQIEFLDDWGNQLVSGVYDIFIMVGFFYSDCWDMVFICIIVNVLFLVLEL